MAFFGRSDPPPTRLEELKKLLQKDPGSRQFLALAEEFRKEGEFAEAIRALENGLRFHPGYVAAHVALGRVCRETGRLDEALRAFLNALKIDRENLVAIKQAAILYAEKGDRVEAVKKFKLYRGLNPGDKEVAEQIERLDLELGTTSRLRSSASPAPPGLPLPQREPSTRPFFTPPPVPGAAATASRASFPPNPGVVETTPPWREGGSRLGEPPILAAKTEPLPMVSFLPPSDPEPPAVRADAGAFELTYDSRPKAPEPDVFLFEVEMGQGVPEGSETAPPGGDQGAVEVPLEDGDSTLPGGPAPGRGPSVGQGAPPSSGSTASGPPDAGARSDRGGEMVTETLANLYLAQGLRTEARKAFEALARSESDAGRAWEFRSRARAIGEEDAASEAAAAAVRARDPRKARLEGYLSLVGGAGLGPGDLGPIVDGMVASGTGIETAIVTETGGVTVVTAGPFGPAEESLGAEMASFWKNLQRGSGDVEAGDPSVVSLVAGGGNAVVTGIGDDYALVLRVAAGAPMGRVRYEAARAASRLRPLLV